jgi:hypothetical protein
LLPLRRGLAQCNSEAYDWRFELEETGYQKESTGAQLRSTDLAASAHAKPTGRVAVLAPNKCDIATDVRTT